LTQKSDGENPMSRPFEIINGDQLPEKEKIELLKAIEVLNNLVGMTINQHANILVERGYNTSTIAGSILSVLASHFIAAENALDAPGLAMKFLGDCVEQHNSEGETRQ
jgi:hypothetical protein